MGHQDLGSFPQPWCLSSVNFPRRWSLCPSPTSLLSPRYTPPPPALLKTCNYPKHSLRPGLAENPAPWDGSHQHGLTSPEIFHQTFCWTYQVNEDFHVALLSGDREAQANPRYLSVSHPKLGTWEVSCVRFCSLSVLGSFRVYLPPSSSSCSGDANITVTLT